MARHRTLLLILVCAAILRLLFSTSFSGNDDLSVASCALRLLDDGLRVPTTHYCARFGLMIPLAAIFGVAGTGATQISLVPALASLGAVLLAYALAARLFDRRTGLVAAAAMALWPMDIEYAGLAFPDALQSALLAASFLFFLRDTTRAAIVAGAFWAWAYYVKLDAFFLGFVLLAATLLRFVSWKTLVVTGAVALALVSIELAIYAVRAGDALLRLHLESVAANEVLAAGNDYRNLATYPKAMFAVPHEAGLHYWLFALGAIAAIRLRSRPALLLLLWCMLWQAWLMFGADPFAGFRLKPQLPRYLLSWSVPMCVLAGWGFLHLLRRARPLGFAAAAGAVACTLVFAPFNQLSYEAAAATRVALNAALQNRWFPLHPDVQSATLVEFLLHGKPEASQARPVQHHDFLRGVTSFDPITQAPAYLLVNEDYARRLQLRSLVRPIDPAGFGLKPVQLLQVDNPMPALSYAALRALATVAKVLPGPLRANIDRTADDVLRPADARIWRLDSQ